MHDSWCHLFNHVFAATGKCGQKALEPMSADLGIRASSCRKWRLQLICALGPSGPFHNSANTYSRISTENEKNIYNTGLCGSRVWPEYNQAWLYRPFKHKLINLTLEFREHLCKNAGIHRSCNRCTVDERQCEVYMAHACVIGCSQFCRQSYHVERSRD